MKCNTVGCLAGLIVGWTATCCGQAAPPAAEVDAEFGAWRYPGATQNSKASFAGTLSQTLLMTKDDLGRVEGYYRKLSHHPLADKPVEAKQSFGIHSTLGYPHPQDKDKQILVIWGDDSKVRTDGDDRGVTVRTMIYDTADELVTVTATRTPTDKESHILLTRLKKK